MTFNFIGGITPGFLYEHSVKTITVMDTPSFIETLRERIICPRVQNCNDRAGTSGPLAYNCFFSYLLRGTHNQQDEGEIIGKTLIFEDPYFK